MDAGYHSVVWDANSYASGVYFVKMVAELGVIDFAGGIVIHTTVGMAALAAALVLGKRRGFGPAINIPHSIPLAVLGSSLLWLGWFGFNAGSEIGRASCRERE